MEIYVEAFICVVLNTCKKGFFVKMSYVYVNDCYFPQNY